MVLSILCSTTHTHTPTRLTIYELRLVASLVLREVRALRERLRVVERTVALVGRVLRQHHVRLRLELVAHEAVL